MSITLHQADGTTKVLKEGLALQAGEVIDASRFVIWFFFNFCIMYIYQKSWQFFIANCYIYIFLQIIVCAVLLNYGFLLEWAWPRCASSSSTKSRIASTKVMTQYTHTLYHGNGSVHTPSKVMAQYTHTLYQGNGTVHTHPLPQTQKDNDLASGNINASSMQFCTVIIVQFLLPIL